MLFSLKLVLKWAEKDYGLGRGVLAEKVISVEEGSSDMTAVTLIEEEEKFINENIEVLIEEVKDGNVVTR